MYKKIAIFLMLLPFLGACSYMEKIKPYKIDIQQGNVVTQEMVAKLKLGMSTSQVRFILGTPPIVDVFHANRWDYVYRYQQAGVLTEERKIALFFEADALKRIEGDVVAATPASEGKPVSSPPAETALPAAEATQNKPEQKLEEKGFFGRMLEKIGL